ncbi:MAG: DUF711 family protein, partial [Chloroflexota bacterium]
MEIRSITFFCNPHYPINTLVLQKAGTFIRHARSVYEQDGYRVQTVRLATLPFPSYLSPDVYISGAQALGFEIHGEGFDYLSMGPALTDHSESYEYIPEMLKTTSNLFLSGMMTTPNGQLSQKAVHACANVIQAISQLEKDGFANLRFAALANVAPWAPFFPAAYHHGNQPAFALALESADLAVKAITEADSLSSARQQLIQAIETHAERLEAIATKLTSIYQIDFKGLDFSLAPFPKPETSIGTALEKLGLPAFGLSGSLAAATFLTDSLNRAHYTRCGFNGLMLPVLEDSILAERAAQRSLSLMDLLLYSAVCGTGLDTIPLPGDTSAEQLYAVLLDIGSLALRLDKPLTARLMPLPGKQAGDPTGFNFEYFA